jgi:hypothetical protein
MIPRVEHIGQPAQLSWPRKFRHWLNDLFGSNYVRLLERDLLQSRLERDRAQSEARAMQERLVEVLAQVKGVPLRAFPQPSAEKSAKPAIPPTRWQEIQAQAIAENARAEAEDAKNAEKEKSAVQEN